MSRDSTLLELPTFPGFKRVTRDEFFAAIGPTDVHPSPEGRYHLVTGYRSDWKTPRGVIVGRSMGGTSLMERAYWLREAQ